VLSFFIIKDIISNNCFEQYKYQVLSLIAIDASFLMYKAKCKMGLQKINKMEKFIEQESESEQISSNLKTASIPSITLSSEINDFKITHDLSLSESENENSMFSTSDEKKLDNKNDNSTNSNKSSSQSVNHNFDILK
jgi:hypothetical protein